MGDAGDRVLIAVQLDATVLADGAALAPQEQCVEGVQIGDTAMISRQAVAEADIGTLAGGGEDAGVVLRIHPGPEGGVQLVDGAEAGDLSLALELVLDDLVGSLDLALAVGLIGRVADVLDVQFDQDGEEVAGDIDLAAVDVDAQRDAVAQQAVAEAVKHGGQFSQAASANLHTGQRSKRRHLHHQLTRLQQRVRHQPPRPPQVTRCGALAGAADHRVGLRIGQCPTAAGGLFLQLQQVQHQVEPDVAFRDHEPRQDSLGVLLVLLLRLLTDQRDDHQLVVAAIRTAYQPLAPGMDVRPMAAAAH